MERTTRTVRVRKQIQGLRTKLVSTQNRRTVGILVYLGSMRIWVFYTKFAQELKCYFNMEVGGRGVTSLLVLDRVGVDHIIFPCL